MYIQKWCMHGQISQRYWFLDKSAKAQPCCCNVFNTYYKTSYSFIICGCGLSLRRAQISLRLLTYSIVSKWFFIHFMATYLPVLILWAFSTSENVPSPFLEINLYSNKKYKVLDNDSQQINRKLLVDEALLRHLEVVSKIKNHIYLSIVID